MPRPHLHPSGCLLWFASLFLLANLFGCNSLHIHKEKKLPENSEVVRARKLQFQMMQFADQYAGVVAQGLDDLAEQMPTPKARADAAFRKVNQASSVVITASGPNPFVNLLDMIVHVSLARFSQERYWVAKVYGEPARPLLERLKIQETNIWNLATNYLSPDQLKELHRLIEQWEKEHPQPHYTAFQNFTQFSSTLNIDVEQAAKQKGSIFSLLHIDPLSGLDRATREVEQTRNLAERAIYYSQRLPYLLKWHGESMFFDLSSTPEIQQMLSMSERWTKTVEQLPELVRAERKATITQLLEGMANERTNVLNTIMAQENRATNVLINLRGTLETARETSTNLNDLAKSVDTLLQRYAQMSEKSATTKPHPFDIREYNAAISNAGVTATQLNLLLNSSDQSMAKVEQDTKALATHIFILALLFLLAMVVAMLLYRFLARAFFGPQRTSGRTGKT